MFISPHRTPLPLESPRKGTPSIHSSINPAAPIPKGSLETGTLLHPKEVKGTEDLSCF